MSEKDAMDEIITFEPGELIVQKGAPSEKAYMIQSGKVSVYLEQSLKKVKLATLTEGDIFGETAIFDGQTYGANVEALEKTELFVITPKFLNTVLKGSDPIIRTILRMLMDRLKKTNKALLDSETRNAVDTTLV